jgi:abortive infection bacteriophage resistance protein
MGGIALEIEEQMALLKERGMELDMKEEKIKEILLDIGYYRLGFYWYPFEKNSFHDFKEETKFSDAVNLYYLDVDLRNILLRYINRIEVSFRTKMIYYVSNKYKSSPTWFIDHRVIDQAFIDKFDKYYNKAFKTNNKSIKAHHQNNINDKYAPAWKTLEFLTFGVILDMFRSLQEEEIKIGISELYEIKSLEKFINIMSTIVFVRNTCAHGGVLFDVKTAKGISTIPQISFNYGDNHCLDSAIKVTLHILGTISWTRKIQMRDEIEAIFMKYADNKKIRGIITSQIGYIYT